MTSFDAGVLEPLGVGREFVDRHPFGDEAKFLQKLAYEFQRSRLISLGLNQDVEHFALGIDGAPEVKNMRPAIFRYISSRCQDACGLGRRFRILGPKWFTRHFTRYIIRLDGLCVLPPPLAMSVLQKAIRRGVKTSSSARRLACRATHLTSSGGASAVLPMKTSAWRALEAVGLATVALAGKRHHSRAPANGSSPTALFPNSAERRKAEGQTISLKGPSKRVRWPFRTP